MAAVRFSSDLLTISGHRYTNATRAAALGTRSLLSSSLWFMTRPREGQGELTREEEREKTINSHEELDVANEKRTETIRPPPRRRRLGLGRRWCEAHVRESPSRQTDLFCPEVKIIFKTPNRMRC